MSTPQTQEALTQKALTQKAIRSEAQAWFVRLRSSDANASDRVAFAQWKLADPEHARAFAQVEAFWDKSQSHLGALARRPEMQAMLAEARQPAPVLQRQWGRWPAALAASLILAVLVGVGLQYFPQSDSQTYVTQLGERRELILDDGSSLVLDTATRVEVAYSSRARKITLVKGRARFNVAPDAERPFVVNAARGTITALGTIFDVRNIDRAVTVTLLEGSVEVAATDESNAKSGKALLKPGERVSYAPALALTRPAPINPDAARGWSEGRLELTDTPLEQAVEEFNLYHHRKIRITEQAVKAMEISGTFSIEDPDAFVAAVTRLFPVKVIALGDDRVLVEME